MQRLSTQWAPTSVQVSTLPLSSLSSPLVAIVMIILFDFKNEFAQLAQTSLQQFPTPQGQVTKELIQYVWNLLGLNITYGCSPNTYVIALLFMLHMLIFYSSYSPDTDYSDPFNLYKLYVEEIVPNIVRISYLIEAFVFLIFINSHIGIRKRLNQHSVFSYEYSVLEIRFIFWPGIRH